MGILNRKSAVQFHYGAAGCARCNSFPIFIIIKEDDNEKEDDNDNEKEEDDDDEKEEDDDDEKDMNKEPPAAHAAILSPSSSSVSSAWDAPLLPTTLLPTAPFTYQW